MFRFGLISTGAASVLAAAASLYAGGPVIPSGVGFSVMYDGKTWDLSDNLGDVTESTFNPNTGEFAVQGRTVMEGVYESDWTISGIGQFGTPTTGPGPLTAFASLAFTIGNFSNGTQNFIVQLTLPAGPINPASMSGSHSGNTGDGGAGGDGSTLATIGGGSALYNALIDGAVARQLLTDPFSISAPIDGTNSYGPVNFSGEAAPAVTTSIGIRNELSVTASDNAGMTSTFRVIPTPGSLTLLAFGGLIALRRRR